MVIKIHVKLATDERDVAAMADGEITLNISEKQRDIFRINEKHLQKVIKTLRMAEQRLHGKPGVVRLLWHDVALKHDWDNITVTIRPVKTEITRIRRDKVIAKSHLFTNNSKNPAEFTSDLREDLKTYTTSWGTVKKMFIASKIDYKIDIPECSGTVPCSTVSVNLDPGEKILANLYFTRYIIELKVIYEVGFAGHVECNFVDWFKTSHRKYRLVDVLKAANLSTATTSSEVIEICCYANGVISLSKL